MAVIRDLVVVVVVVLTPFSLRFPPPSASAPAI
jgi:hypothetical protein